MNSGFRHDVGVQSVAEVDWVDIVTMGDPDQLRPCKKMARQRGIAYHSKSLYMMVKKTCRKRLTAFMRTARR